VRVVANRKYKENSAVSTLIELLFYLLAQETQKVHAHEKRSLTKARSQNQKLKNSRDSKARTFEKASDDIRRQLRIDLSFKSWIHYLKCQFLERAYISKN
jgi:hypothetical protein